VLAIENDRCSSVPGIVMSTYWPGLNSSGSSGVSLRNQMSAVSGSTASTVVATVRGGVPPVQRLLVVVDELDLEV
jgi:hypothetical protein